MFKRSIYLALFFSLFFISKNYSQEIISIHGNLLDIDRKPIINANITVKSLNIGTVSNEKGEFKLTIPKKKKYN